MAEVLERLSTARLLTVGDGHVEVAHEALLREWPRLQGWLADDAAGREVRLHLIGAVRDWEQRGREPGDLYRGARLATALEWAGRARRRAQRIRTRLPPGEPGCGGAGGRAPAPDQPATAHAPRRGGCAAADRGRRRWARGAPGTARGGRGAKRRGAGRARGAERTVASRRRSSPSRRGSARGRESSWRRPSR